SPPSSSRASSTTSASRSSEKEEHRGHGRQCNQKARRIGEVTLRAVHDFFVFGLFFPVMGCGLWALVTRTSGLPFLMWCVAGYGLCELSGLFVVFLCTNCDGPFVSSQKEVGYGPT
ncbi:Os08g0449200, partial [Oryza sativa Japonica Group]